MFAHDALGHRRILASRVAVAAALLCLAPSPLHAANRFWITSGGGSFGTPGVASPNWSNVDGGAGNFTAPTTPDIANFTLNNTYTVTFAAGVTNNDLDVDNGNVTFDLGGLTYTLTSVFGVDIASITGQTGRLTVRDGTLKVDTNGDNVSIGNNAGSTGFLTVTTGARIGDGTIRPDIIVASISTSTGTLTVNDNGRIDGGILLLGDESGATGTATITGPNALGIFSGITTVGNAGAGTMNVTNGGNFASSSTVTLGNTLGADGTATVSGVSSSWSISGSTIGNAGDGTLTISAGGLVVSTGPVTLGSTATGVGTATVTGAGSRCILSAAHTIGSNGLGVMTVSSGGQIDSSSSATLGLNLGSEGRVTVTGAGSQWTLGSTLIVGGADTGDLTVSAGGEVSAGNVFLGANATGDGAATITGTGSKLTTSANVVVASLGSGTLDVASGAEVYVGSNLSLFNPAGTPIGTLNLDGGSIFVAGAFTNNGAFNFTDGLLQVAGNFQPSAAAATLTINGSDSDDLPTLDLIGAGTTTNVAEFSVGTTRRGELLLRQGRVLDVGVNNVNIGALVGGEGTIGVQSGAQLLTALNLLVGGSGGTAGGTGTLAISGGTVDAAALRLFRDGTVNLSGGTLAVDTLPVLDGQFNWTGGTLRFDLAFSLTSANVPKLLGLDATLGAGQALTSSAGVPVTLQTPVIVDGGTLSANSLINQSRLEVRSGSIGAVQNDGLLLGDGTISGAVTNSAAGRIRVDAGKTLFFSGTFAANAGELNLQGGTLDFTGAITNGATGFIAGRGTLYTGGLTNNGQMAFSGGTADVHGDVTLAAGSRVVTSGAGSVTTFYDDVVHNGLEIFTGASASSVFFGALSGAGPFTGTGTVYSIGDLRPGNSPATVSFGGSLVLGSSTTLTMELGGLAEGTQFDRLVIAGSVSLAGALDADLINGFAPGLGNQFTVLTFGSRSGDFASYSGLDVGGHLALRHSFTSTSLLLTARPAIDGDINLDGTVNIFDINAVSSNWSTAGPQGDANGDGIVNIFDINLISSNWGATGGAAAVPEPATLMLALCGLLGVVHVRGRHPRA